MRTTTWSNGKTEVVIERRDDWRSTDWAAVCKAIGAEVFPTRLAHMAKTAEEEFAEQKRGYTMSITYSLTPENTVRQFCCRPATAAEAVQNASDEALGY